MENWGLVMYRETALLYDSSVNSESNKASVATVVAHELSHQVKVERLKVGWKLFAYKINLPLHVNTSAYNLILPTTSHIYLQFIYTQNYLGKFKTKN